MDESLRMQCDEDCRTAGFGKTERPVGWEGNGEPITMGLVRHCEGKPAATDRLHLPSLSHSFALDFLAMVAGDKQEAEAIKMSDKSQRYTARALCKECHLKLHGGSFNPKRQKSNQNAGYIERCSSGVGSAG